MVDPKHPNLSIRNQCSLMSISRSSYYYLPKPEKPENLRFMHIMDAHLTEHPDEGVVSVILMFQTIGIIVGPKRIRRLLRLMGRETIFRRKNLTKSGLKQYIKPYLLRNLSVVRSNQVWCTDITYIPMKHGFLYLTAYIDVYSRKIVGWGLSNTMTVDWCLDVLKRAISNMDALRSSIAIRVVNIQAACGSRSWNKTGYRYQWMKEVVPWINYGLKDFGSQ